MSGLTDRITEVLQEHREAAVHVSACLCGWGYVPGGPKDHPAHVAEAVEAAIQPEMTAELQRRYRQGAAENSWHMP